MSKSQTVKIPQGIIELNTEAAKHLGFTEDSFSGYLWRTGNTITISVIIAKKKGEFCKLIKRIRELGFDFEIPTPSNRMIEIGIKQKWNFCQRDSEQFGAVDILTNKRVGR